MISIEELRNSRDLLVDQFDSGVKDQNTKMQITILACAIATIERLDKLIELATPDEMTREDLLRLSESLNPKLVCPKCGIFTETIVCMRCGFDMREDKPEDDAEEYPAPDGHDARLEADEKLDQELRDAGRR